MPGAGAGAAVVVVVAASGAGVVVAAAVAGSGVVFIVVIIVDVGRSWADHLRAVVIVVVAAATRARVVVIAAVLVNDPGPTTSGRFVRDAARLPVTYAPTGSTSSSTTRLFQNADMGMSVPAVGGLWVRQR